MGRTVGRFSARPSALENAPLVTGSGAEALIAPDHASSPSRAAR